jgi:hypothetical protein
MKLSVFFSMLSSVTFSLDMGQQPSTFPYGHTQSAESSLPRLYLGSSPPPATAPASVRRDDAAYYIEERTCGSGVPMVVLLRIGFQVYPALPLLSANRAGLGVLSSQGFEDKSLHYLIINSEFLCRPSDYRLVPLLLPNKIRIESLYTDTATAGGLIRFGDNV